MRPIIPTDILMRETAELQKSVAADLSVPDPIITQPTVKSTKKSKESAETIENSPKHDRGTGNIDDNASIPATGE